MNNPLLEEFNTPFSTLPFDQINAEHFLPAIEKEIEKTRAEVDAICQHPQPPSFENTLEALEKSGKRLGIISGTLFNLNSAETNAALQETTQKAAPLLTQLQNDIRLNIALFERIKTVFEEKQPHLKSRTKNIARKRIQGICSQWSLVK